MRSFNFSPVWRERVVADDIPENCNEKLVLLVTMRQAFHKNIGVVSSYTLIPSREKAIASVNE